MNQKQRIVLITTFASAFTAYVSIYIYQRIQRAKADANVTSSDDAIRILQQKKKYTNTEPNFNDQDTIPQTSDNPDDTAVDCVTNPNDPMCQE
jgi:hypothetical protein